MGRYDPIILAGLLVLLVNGSAATLDQGLVGYWKLDSGSGSEAIDSADFDDNGSVKGASWISGRLGSGLSLDGSGDYVSIEDSADLSTDRFTVSAWTKHSGIGDGTNDRLVYKLASEGTNQDNYALGVDDSGYPYIDLEETDGTDVYVRSQETIPENTWVHLAGTYDGNKMSIYVNGSLENSKTSIDDPYTGSGGHFLIGSRQDDGGGMGEESYYSGAVDEVRVYQRALNSSEVETLYNYRYSICDERGRMNQCLMTGVNSLEPDIYVIDTLFISKKTSHLESLKGDAELDIGNRSRLSGTWRGSISLKSREAVLEPGLKLRPENRIIISESQ